MTSAPSQEFAMPATSNIWSDAPEVVRLFPSFVWKSALRSEVHESLNKLILGRLDAMRRGLPPLQRGKAWQSSHCLHTLNEFSALVSCIDAAAQRVLEFLRIDSNALCITGCWANIYAPGSSHRMHTHPNNYFSGVYYVQVQEGANSIAFHDPRPETAVIRPPVTELTAYNTDQVLVTVENGTLLVFPAWLPHTVDENRSECARISVSFNLMFTSFAETMAKPLWGET